MTVSYDKLWSILKSRNMKKKDLLFLTGLSPTTMAKLGRDEIVAVEVLMRICKALDCNVDDVMDFVVAESTEIAQVFCK